METPDLKHCPLCSADLPIDEFGICRARKDGKNLYCRTCINAKVTASRRALREYKAVQKQRIERRAEHAIQGRYSLFKLSPIDRVREAVRKGCRTQGEIATATMLSKDEIGEALANLLLWTREIRTQVIDETRLYFLNEPQEKPLIVYPESLSLADYLLKRGPVVRGERKVRRVA